MKVIGTCRYCEHWKSFDRSRMSESLWKERENRGRCDSKYFIYDMGLEFKDGALYYSDHEGCSAFFDTHEDFGCIHWKKK
jgi:hypothetical protein